MSDKQFHSKSILCKFWGKFLKLTVRYILKSILVESLFLFVTLNLIDCFFQNLWFCEKCLVFHRVYLVWFTTTSIDRFWVKLRMTIWDRKYRFLKRTKTDFYWTLLSIFIYPSPELRPPSPTRGEGNKSPLWEFWWNK